MIYENYHFWGMHLLWWFIWGFMLLWIFAIPYDIPFQRSRRATPLDLLKRRFASGQINKEEFKDMRSLLEN